MFVISAGGRHNIIVIVRHCLGGLFVVYKTEGLYVESRAKLYAPSLSFTFLIVPAMNILGDHVTTARTSVSQTPEPLSMDIKGKRRIISAAYGML